MPTDLVNDSLRYAYPLSHPLEDRSNTPRIERPTDLESPNQPAKHRSLVYSGMLHPNLQPPYGLARKISHSALPLGIGLTAADQRLTSAVWPELN